MNNLAEVDSDTPDSTGPNSTSEITAIAAEADLTIAKTDSQDPATAGTVLTYTLTITNSGPSNAANVVVTDTLPAGVVYRSASSDCSYGSGVVSCSLGSLVVDSSKIITVAVTINQGTTIPLTNLAQVGSDTPDSTGPNSTSESTAIAAEADLTISKTDSQDPATAGTVLTYTLTITNSGPSNAVNVVVTDTLPAGVTYASASTGCSSALGEVSCILGSLNVDVTQIITVAVTVNQGTTIPLTNLAQVASDTPDSTGPNSTSEITAIAAEADLTISKTDSQDPATAGTVLTYTLTITNSGPSNAANVVVTDTLPAGVTYASASTGCSHDSGVVTCGLGSLVNAATKVITVAVTINQGTTIPLTNLAQVGSDTPDSTGPNSTSESTAIAAEADLTISKTDSQDPATAGTVLTYTLTITNSGPSNAANVVVTDTLPAGVTYASASTGCSHDSGVVTCGLGSLVNAATKVITVAVTINQGTTIPLTNLAQVGSDTPDSTGPNSTSEITAIAAEADLTIAKTDSQDPVAPGETLTYTLTITNSGPSNAVNVVVTDTLPAGVTYASASTGCSSALGEVSCILGSLNVDVTQIITVTVTVNQGTTIPLTNLAQVASDTPDSTGPNSTSEITAIAAEADLTISKTDSQDPATAGTVLTYTLTITNSGPSNAANVVVTDTLPSGVTYASASTGCSHDSGVVTCGLGSLVNAETKVITVAVTINQGTTIPLNNLAQVGSDSPDSTGPNSTSEITAIVAVADLSLTKSVDNATPKVGDNVRFTVRVDNDGPSDATGVMVLDALPSGYNKISSSDGSYNTGTGLWTIGPLPAASFVELTITATVKATGVYTNVAQVAASGQTDPDSQPNNDTGNQSQDDEDSASVTPTAEADLTIAKTDSQDPATAGTVLTYTLTITNSGPSNAANVVVTDTLPAGVIYASASTGCSHDSGVVTCGLGSLVNAATKVITVAVTINQGTTIPLTNLAQVASDTPDSTGPNSTSESTAIAAEADLTISKTDSQDPATAGTVLTYTLTITNSGPSNAANVVVTDTLPSGVTYASASTGCSHDSGGGHCGLGSLVNAASRKVITVAVTVNQGTTIPLNNLAQVASDTPDSTGPNSTSEITAIAAEADLTISKTDSQDPATAGTVLTYTLTITNSGPSNAANVVVTDTLPSGVVYRSASSDCSYGSGVVSCSLGSLVVDSSKIITVAVTINQGTTIPLTNLAQVGSDTPDSTGPNSTSESTAIAAEADLTIAKTDSQDPATAGTVLTYTLTITNSGPSNAANVVVTDTLPAGVVYRSASSDCSYGSGVVSCSLGSLVVDSSKIITVAVTVNQGTTIPLTNLAQVASDTPDSTGPNSTSEITAIAAEADLTISKTDSQDPATAGTVLTYTLTITNSGPSNAANVVVTDTLPTGVTYASASSGCSHSSAEINCILGTLNVNATRIITVAVIVDPSTTGILQNSAGVASDITDPNSTNDLTFELTTVNSLADLAIGQGVSPDPVTAGNNLTYTLTITNLGPSTATSVVVTDTLPSGVSLVTAAFSQGTGCAGNSQLICNLGILAVQSTATITVVGTVDSGITTTLNNFAEVNSITVDPIAGNNRVTSVSQVDSSTDLILVKIDSPDPVASGEDLTYTLTITNVGPSDAVGVVVTDGLPIDSLLVSAVSSQGSGCQGMTTVACTLGTLIAHQSATVTIVVALDPSLPPTVLNNSAEVGSDTSDMNSSNDRDEERTTVEALSDLVIHQSDFPDPVIAGTNLTYTLIISNIGPSDATGIVVTDTLPAEVTLISATPGQGAGCSQSPITVCNLGSLSPGESTAITIVLEVIASTAGTIENIAIVSSDQRDPQPDNNEISLLTSVNRQGSLPFVKNDTPDPVRAGTNLTYTLHISSSGPSDMFGVVLTDTLPTETSFIEVTQTAGTCVHQSGTVLCNLGDMPEGSEATVQIITLVDPATLGQINNSASVGADGEIPSQANQNTTVIGSANLAINNVGLPNPVVAGESLTYTVDVTNHGPSLARGVNVVYFIPTGSMFKSSSDCTPVAATLLCTIGDLSVGDTSSLSIVVDVFPDTIGPITGAATVFSDTPDPDFTNNGESEITNVVAESDLGITKTAATNQVVAGTMFTYTLAIYNDGPSVARNVVVTDSLPSGVNLVSARDNHGINCSGVTELNCNLGILTAGSTATVTIVVDVYPSTSGLLLNSAGVASASADPDPANNGALKSVAVVGEADLSLTKSESADPVTAGTPLTYLLTVNNAGPSDATAVVLTDTLPSGVILQSTSSSQGQACLVNGSGTVIITCMLGDLSYGAGATVTVVVEVDSGRTETLQNNATISSETYDPNLLNNGAVEETGVVSSADLMIGLESSPDPVVAGELLTYTIQVANAGPSDATGVVITDTLPAGTSLISLSAGCIDGTPISCVLGELSANAGTIVTVVVRVDLEVSGTISSTATIIGDQPDPVPGNNNAAEFTNVGEKIYTTYLPLILQRFDNIDEPNNTCEQAHKIITNFGYTFLPNDSVDWYQFVLPRSGSLAVELTNFKPLFGQVAVFAGVSCDSRILLGSNGSPSTTKIVNAGVQPAGHYYIFLSNDGKLNDQDNYNLLVKYTP